jgi:hypothetical protein
MEARIRVRFARHFAGESRVLQQNRRKYRFESWFEKNNSLKT